MISRRVTITGRVQGVGFRWTARDLANGFDVCGSVRNLPDGCVEILIMGEEDEVDDFLRELSEESVVAHHIKDLQSRDIPPLEGVRGFSIAR